MKKTTNLPKERQRLVKLRAHWQRIMDNAVEMQSRAAAVLTRIDAAVADLALGLANEPTSTPPSATRVKRRQAPATPGSHVSYDECRRPSPPRAPNSGDDQQPPETPAE